MGSCNARKEYTLLANLEPIQDLTLCKTHKIRDFTLKKRLEYTYAELQVRPVMIYIVFVFTLNKNYLVINISVLFEV